MAGLGDTTAYLAGLRAQARAAARPLDGGHPALHETADFGDNPGQLRMLSYAPAALPEGAPLVVVLHGCGQSAAGHAAAAGWLQLADRCGFAVVAPEQSASNNPNRCFNWFEPQDARRGRGEAASIRAMVAQACARFASDPARVFVTGLSAGGAMAAVMLAAYPEVFAGGGIVAGLAYGVADNVREATGAMFGPQPQAADALAALVLKAAPAVGRLPRVSIWQGDADTTVNPQNALEIAKQWSAAHGLGEKPAEVKVLGRRTRRQWRGAVGGEVLVEHNLVGGLGHGTPLAAGGPDGLGAPAPFMLEAGLSSTLEIARFWGLAPAAAAVESPADVPKAARQMAAGPAYPNLQDAITQALKAAGLMK